MRDKELSEIIPASKNITVTKDNLYTIVYKGLSGRYIEQIRGFIYRSDTKYPILDIEEYMQDRIIIATWFE